MSTLQEMRVQDTLSRLHLEASADLPRIVKGFAASLGRGLRPHHMKDAYIAVGPGQGRLLYSLARGAHAQNIVEFGTSFAISTLYLGAAARDNGGHVVTTEIEPDKCRTARTNIAAAGLSDVVTLLEGDALITLERHDGPIDLLFLDGWSDLYVPLLNLLAPRMRPAAMLVVDNASFPKVKAFLHRLEEHGSFVMSRIKSERGAMSLGCLAEPWQPMLAD